MALTSAVGVYVGILSIVLEELVDGTSSFGKG